LSWCGFQLVLQTDAAMYIWHSIDSRTENCLKIMFRCCLDVSVCLQVTTSSVRNSGWRKKMNKCSQACGNALDCCRSIRNLMKPEFIISVSNTKNWNGQTLVDTPEQLPVLYLYTKHDGEITLLFQHFLFYFNWYIK